MELPKNHRYIGATIILENTGDEYHTVSDWKLCITSSVHISEPEQQTTYIEVPGANTMLDVSEALTGRPTFKKREINIELAGIEDEMSWDATISKLRNTIEGRLVRIIFDNDPSYYWRGRAHITGFDRAKRLGRFTISLPQADPYKYNVLSNIDPWLWDPFDFDNESIPDEPIISIDGVETVTVLAGTMPTVPEFTVQKMDTPITLTANGKTYTMTNGYNYFPALMINGDKEVTLTFKGKGEVVMEYRGGSL